MKLINVPFAEKEQAKKLGAKWDKEQKCWFIPEYLDEKPFEKWIKNSQDKKPEIGEPGVNHFTNNSYFLVSSKRECWKCEEETNVFGILMPEGTGILIQKEAPDDIDEESEEFYDWIEGEDSHEVQPSQFPFYISYVQILDEETKKMIAEHTQNINFASTKAFGKKYFINCCEHCGSKQGDHSLFEDYDAVFLPTNPDDYENLSFNKIEKPISISGTPVWNEEYYYLNKDFCETFIRYIRSKFPVVVEQKIETKNKETWASKIKSALVSKFLRET